MDNNKILLERINILEEKIDEILVLLRPVSSHAAFVDDLKNVFNNSRVLQTLGLTTSASSSKNLLTDK